MSAWDVALDAKAVLGEGPLWDDVSNTLLFVDIERGEIHRFDPTTGKDESIALGEKIGSVVPRADGGFVAGLADGAGLLDDDGRVQRRVPVEANVANSRMNDGKCDAAGRFWTGTMTDDASTSALYCVGPDLEVRRILTGIGISNGLGWSPDGTRMYYIDTPTRSIDVLDFASDTGTAKNRRPFVDLARSDGYPDGMTVDADGHLWVAFWDGGCIRRYDPAGALERTILLPVARPTSCAFGGPALRDLYVTSASRDLTASDLAKQPLAGALFRIDAGVAGLPANRFRLATSR